MILTNRFRSEWRAEMGRDPVEEEVQDIVRDGIRIVKGRSLQDHRGDPYDTLSVYWAPARGLVIKIDDYRHAAVSVISARGQRTEDREQKEEDSGGWTSVRQHGQEGETFTACSRQ